MGWKSIVAALVAVVVAFVIAVAVSFRIRSTARVEAVIDAPVTQVWTQFADPELIKQWWGPHKYSAPMVVNDLRVGGKFIFAMLSPSNDINYNAGVYTEVLPKERISADMWFADENGNRLTGDAIKVPGNWPDTVKVTTTFVDAGDKTRVVVTEEGIPLIMKFLAQVGWSQQFEKMNAAIKKGN